MLPWKFIHILIYVIYSTYKVDVVFTFSIFDSLEKMGFTTYFFIRLILPCFTISLVALSTDYWTKTLPPESSVGRYSGLATINI